MHSTVSGISAESYRTGLAPTPSDKNEIEHSKPTSEVARNSAGHTAVELSEARKSSQETTLPQTVAFANAVAELFDTKLSFNFDERIGRVVVRVKAANTDEVIRQIPPEQMVELAVNFKSQLRGLIVNHQG